MTERTRSRLLLAGASASALLVAACSLTGFDGFVGPKKLGASDDTSLPEDGDASSDAPSTDIGAENDAGSDSGPAGEVPPSFVDGGTFCAESPNSTATFCDDFDSTPLDVKWVREGVFANLSTVSPRSAPNDFFMNAPANTGIGTFVSKLTRSFVVGSTNLVVAFDFFPEKVHDGTAALMLGALEWSKGSEKYSLRLVYGNGAVRLEESDLVAPPNNKDSYHPFFNVPVGKWTRVKLDVVASGSNPGVTVSLDDTAVGLRETITPTPGMDTTPTLILGAVYAANPQSGWALRYDNVTVNYR